MMPALDVMLGDVRAGMLVRGAGGRVQFLFAEQYADMPNRPRLSLSYEDEGGELIAVEPRAYSGRLPPFFSNLLPEGPLRDLLIRRAEVRPSDEFALLRALGEDLPGGVSVVDSGTATLDPATGRPAPRREPGDLGELGDEPLRFSLSGVQIKISAALNATGGLTIPAAGVGGDWIVKLPSLWMDAVPDNEFAMMTLAGESGISVPEVRLVSLDDISGLPKEMRDLTGRALAVRRFDRQEGGQRVHMEDFAQVFGKFPEGKYESHSYANIASVLADTTANGRDEAMALVRQVVFSALIGNGDAHLKNWSVLYEDPIRPTLSPAYDLVSTIPYIPRDRHALGFGGSKDFQPFDDRRVRRFAKAAQLPLEAVRKECRDTAERTMAAWPEHEPRGRLPQEIDDVVSAHMESVALDITRPAASRVRRPAAGALEV